LSRPRRCQTPPSEADAPFQDRSGATQKCRSADPRLRRRDDPRRVAALPTMKPQIDRTYRLGLLRRYTRAKPAETLCFGRNDGAFFGETSSAGVTTKSKCFQWCNDVTTKMRGKGGSDLHLTTTPSRNAISSLSPPHLCRYVVTPYIETRRFIGALSVTTPRNDPKTGSLRRYAGSLRRRYGASRPSDRSGLFHPWSSQPPS
jgi:hypothetical protein